MSDRLLQIISKADTALQGAETATIERVNVALESSYKQLEKRLLSSYDKHQGNISLLPKQRSLVILDEVSTLLSLVDKRNSESIQADFQDLLRTADDQGATLADVMVNAIANEKLADFASVPLEAVRMQAENGLKRLSRHTEEFRNKASAIVEVSLVQGHGARRVAAALRSELGITKGKAEMIARTEAVSSHNQAIAANLQRNGYELVQVFATVDDRVCATCAARNQNIYKVDEISLPFHPYCRCVIAPMSQRWIDAGLVDQEWSRKFKEGAIAELEKQGKKPGYGLSPFEKMNGVTEPPQAVWKPVAARKLSASGDIEQPQSAAAMGTKQTKKKDEPSPLDKLKAEFAQLKEAFGAKQDEVHAIQTRMFAGEKLQAELDKARESLDAISREYSAKKKELKKLTQPETQPEPATKPEAKITKIESELKADPNSGKPFKAFIKDGSKFMAETEDIKVLKASGQALAKLDKAKAVKFDALAVLYEKMIEVDASDAKPEEKQKSHFEFKEKQRAYNEFDMKGYSERRKILAEIEPSMANIRQRLIDRSAPAMAKALAEKLKMADSIPPETQKILRDEMESFYQISGGKGGQLNSLEHTESRANAREIRRSINIGDGIEQDQMKTLWHEAGHHVEFESSAVLSASKLWVESRATGAPQQLRVLIDSSYDKDEIAYPDDFVSPYVGKIYKYSSEVVSMGLEHFNTPARMADLYSKDAEHFLFTLGVIL